MMSASLSKTITWMLYLNALSDTSIRWLLSFFRDSNSSLSSSIHSFATTSYSKMLSLSFVVPFMVLLPSFVSATAINGPSRSELKNYYTRSHSLGNDYKFDSREWHSVNVTNLDYKYDQPLQERDKKAPGTENTGSKNMGGTISHLINDIWNGLKGLGKSETVKITW